MSYLSELNMHSLGFPAIQSHYINTDFPHLEDQFTKSHNKFNREFFIMVSIIKSTAPKQDDSSSFWSVFTFRLRTFNYSIHRQLLLLYIMNAVSVSRQTILAAFEHFKVANCVFEK